MRKIIKNEINDVERAYYGSNGVSFSSIKIMGPADGESAFKECRNIDISNSVFKLRYPFWHNTNADYYRITLSKDARAAWWYDKNITLNKVKSKGIKGLRECKNITIIDSYFESMEIGWNCHNVLVFDSYIEGFYAFMGSTEITINNLNFKGKYSFQYTKNVEISNSNLDTKDAFWHAKNVTVNNCVVKGEYLAWYSENLTFVNCKIIGTQPFCYCKGLKLINCTTEACDLAFENSEVNGNIIGDIVSIKNPMKGELTVTGKIGEVIVDEFDRSNGQFKLNN
ncbi:MAG: DUF3737 family protein [Bacilli bacterium]|nr:DUF3737 family protein [Bacilli bacterium]